MSNRQLTRENRRQLREALLEDFRSGKSQVGDALPPLRELASRHGLSPATTQRVLRGLADEGIVQLRQGAGAFIGRLPEHTESAFAAVFGDEQTYMVALRAAREGFESEIARRSAASLTLTPEMRGLTPLLHNIGAGDLKIAGFLYVPSMDPAREINSQNIVDVLGNIPRVVYEELTVLKEARLQWQASRNRDEGITDTIRFDDHDGALQAVRHLKRRGHDRIAFLALHTADSTRFFFDWSYRRAEGFLSALETMSVEGQVFNSQSEPAGFNEEDQEQAAREAALPLVPLLQSGEIKAVICVNQFALMGLLWAARQAELPESAWPAIVAFDDWSRDDHLLSVLRLPWDDMGQAAAVALWERTCGTPAQREAPPREIIVPMRLVVRLSCFDNYDTLAVADAAFAQR